MLIATNGYTDGLWPGLARTVVPMMSFQAATGPLPPRLGAGILRDGHCASDTRRLLWYYRRDAHGRLVMGGRAPFREDLGRPMPSICAGRSIGSIRSSRPRHSNSTGQAASR